MVTQVQPGMFVAYEWDSKWYIGSVIDTDEYELEICISTMTPYGPARSSDTPHVETIHGFLGEAF